MKTSLNPTIQAADIQSVVYNNIIASNGLGVKLYLQSYIAGIVCKARFVVSSQDLEDSDAAIYITESLPDAIRAYNRTCLTKA